MFAPKCPFISKERCVGLHAGVGTAHIPIGAASTSPSPAKKEHRALNFPLDISPPLSFGLLQRQQPSLIHAAPRLALNYLKAQQVF